MKARKLIAILSAVSVMSTMAISASATKLGDVLHPSEEDATMNDAYYSVGAIPFFMSQAWSWNQGDWVNISDDGKLVIDFKISEVLADTTMSGKGTLGDMGVMVSNLPDNYPFDVTITDAKFTATDGTVTNLDSVNAITEATEDAEGSFRIHIRPTDEVDADTGEVKKAATPEVAGWDQEGAFNGGTLSMTIDFGVEVAGGDDSSSQAGSDSSKKDDSSSKKDDSSSKKDDKSSTAAGTTAGGTTTKNSTAAGGTTTAAPKDEANTETGVESIALAGIALAGAALVVSKKKK